MATSGESSILVLPKFPGSKKLVEIRPVRHGIKRAIKDYFKVSVQVGKTLPHVPLAMQVWTITKRLTALL